LGGLSHGSLFRISDAVDTTKAPGIASSKPNSPQQVEPWTDVLRKIVSFESFIYSPNLSWFLMACIIWQFCPYPTNPEPSFSWIEFVQGRLFLNTALAFGYIGFWHVTLYGFHWCHRPFVPNRTYSRQRVLHNMFYTMWGILHWTLVETAFVNCYQTNQLTQKVTHMTVSDLVVMMALAMWTPSFRDVHFYVCHRMIHIRWLYKYIHSLHHRNIDVEPFSGLAMHPVEHLYYFTCYGPFLLSIVSQQPYAPFLIFWMNFHTALSPAAAHSGWEDHFSADLAHYLHHRYCDCNYGAAINFDALFGTYQSCIKGSDSYNNTVDPKQYNSKQQTISAELKQSSNTKAALGWMPENAKYQGSVVLLIAATLGAHCSSLISSTIAAILLTFGPAVSAFALAFMNRPASLPWRKAFLAPFDKDPLWSLILHFGLGIALGILPATYLVYLVVNDP
jgi:sterol desaturase/sphingolipid hydroxylase (fatty acid hydroxylase superfamily)